LPGQIPSRGIGHCAESRITDLVQGRAQLRPTRRPRGQRHSWAGWTDGRAVSGVRHEQL